MEIRYVSEVDDKFEISRIYEESWRSAYKGIIPQPYLDEIPKGKWAGISDIAGWNTLVCIDEGKIVGTTTFSASRYSQFPNWGEIITLYLFPQHMGKGYGKALNNMAIAELKRLGYEKIFLWVLEENERARRFYEKQGFSLSGENLEDNIGGKDIIELAYVYRV